MTAGKHPPPAATVSRERVVADDGTYATMVPLETDGAAGDGPRELALADLRLDAGTQMRVRLDQAAVAEYARDLLDGDQLPPVTAVSDGATTWLVDGFHRVAAAHRAGRIVIQVLVRHGTHRDAILAAAGANQEHGLRRTRADKQRAIQTLLADPEWAAWSDHHIATACGVNQSTVSRIRARSDESAVARPPMRRAIRGGTAYAMRVTALSPAQDDQPAVASELIPEHATAAGVEGTADGPAAPPGAWPETAGNGRHDTAGITAEWRNLAHVFMVEAQARLRTGETEMMERVTKLKLYPETIAALACGWHQGGPISLDDHLVPWSAGLVVPAYDGAGLLSEVLLLSESPSPYRLGPCPETPIWWPPQTATSAAAVFVCQDSLMGLYRWQASKGKSGVLVLSPGEFARRFADLIPPPLSSSEEEGR